MANLVFYDATLNGFHKSPLHELTRVNSIISHVNTQLYCMRSLVSLEVKNLCLDNNQQQSTYPRHSMQAKY